MSFNAKIRELEDLPEMGFADSVDLALIDEMDPNILDGYRLYYEREIPLELRAYDGCQFPTEVGNIERLRVKLLVKGEDNHPDALRIELASENNLFFHFLHDMRFDEYQEVQECQRLMIEFYEYPKLLSRLFSACIKEPQHYIGLLYFNGDKTARLDFVQNMQHKFVELLQVDFAESDDETTKRQITYRYNAIKSKAEVLAGRLADFNAMVKIKNPSLLQQMKSKSLKDSTGKKSFRP